MLRAADFHRIAVFRALQLGDMMCAVPALRALRAACPDAHITLIGLPWAEDFVRRVPYLDDFIAFPGFPGLPERIPDLARLPHFFASVRAREFDLAIQLHGDGTLSNCLLGAFGARRMAGFYPFGDVCPDPEGFMAWPEQLPEVRRLLALTGFLDCPDRGLQLELPLHPDEERAALRLFASLPEAGRGYVCIHPGARMRSRRWPLERFAGVADAIAADGWTVLLTGAQDEAGLLDELQETMHEPAVSLAGRTTLGTLAALLARVRLIVCNDTGVSHIAAAVGTPSVVVCNGADPMRWAPLDRQRHHILWHDVPCRPCSHERCPLGHECALGVSVGMVIEEAAKLLVANDRVEYAKAE